MLLSINDLSVQYITMNGTARAVNNVFFCLEKGQTLGLVGESGAGKTTLAKAIMGILPEPPARITGGEILFNGQDLLKKNKKEMRAVRGDKISMIFEDPMTALNPVIIVGDQIAEVITLHEKISPSLAREKAKQTLELVGIPRERYAEYPHQFSGGMKQRVVIAIALACRPELLLADEPTTALDVTIQAQVLEMMKDIRSKMGMSMIMITHDLGIVADICDKVAVIYAGSIVEFGSTEDIFDRAGHPYTKGLFESLPNADRREARLKPIKGSTPNAINLPEGCRFHPRCPEADENCKSGDIPLRETDQGHFVRCTKETEVK